MKETARVLIASPAGSCQRKLTESVESDSELKLVGSVQKEGDVVKAVSAFEPDILVIDLGMSEGTRALDIVRAVKKNLPNLAVIVMSSLLNTNLTMKALAAGALEYVAKDSEKVHSTAPEKQFENALRSAKTFVSKAKGVDAKEVALSERTAARSDGSQSESNGVPHALRQGFDLILIGISTGGPAALETVLKDLGDRDLPPILIIQHMGRLFTSQLAESLEKQSGREIKEAWRQSPLRPNTIYIAPGGFQTEIRSAAPSEDFCRLRVVEEPPVNGFCPSVDVTWKSIARNFEGRIAAFLMTGMGEDGMEGMRVLQAKGAVCIAQDEESSVVWGMPRAAVREGVCDEVMSLDAIRKSFHEVLGRPK